MKRNKGITLIALVITIIVLVILASISISAVFGEGGIIDRTQKAANAQEDTTEIEREAINDIINEFESKDTYLLILVADAYEQRALNGAIIEIYSDKSCTSDKLIDRIDMTQNGAYDYTYKNLAKGSYWVKVVQTPDGYNDIVDALRFEVTEEEQQKWIISFFVGMELPESSAYTYILTNGNQWEIGECIDGNINEGWIGSSTKIQVYKIGTVDNDGIIKANEKYKLSITGQNINNIINSSYELSNIVYNNIVEQHIKPDKTVRCDILGYADEGNLSYEYDEGIYLLLIDDIETELYKYSFQPTLIQVKEFEPKYAIEGPLIEMKVSKLKIETIIDNYNPNIGDSSIVYRVKGDYGGEEVYNNVLGVGINGSASQTIEVDALPAGAHYTIIPVYHGGYYCVTSDYIEGYMQENNKVAFEYEWDGTNMTYSYVCNNFTYNKEEREWNWNSLDLKEVSEDSSSKASIMNVPVYSSEITNIGNVTTSTSSIITINNDEDKRPVYVRAKVFYGWDEQSYFLNNPEGWFQSSEPGYFELGYALEPGCSTEEFEVSNDFDKSETSQGEFNVIVIIEATPILINEEGEVFPMWAEMAEDWLVMYEETEEGYYRYRPYEGY